MKTVTLLGVITVVGLVIVSFIMIRKQNKNISALINKAHPSLATIVDNGNGTADLTDGNGTTATVGLV